MLLDKYEYEYISGEFRGLASRLTCKDRQGYYLMCNIEKMVYKNTKAKRVHPSNPYSILNINLFLEKNASGKYKCISDSYEKNNDYLVFECQRCGSKIKNKWINVCRDRYLESPSDNKTGLFCEHCEQRKKESAHATVLKQVWEHEEPDTITEDKSVVNDKTGKIMPTDIVNHRLKIAIEVQSWYHDFPDIMYKDEIKKNYWISHGYKFYAIDHRDYSIIQMINLFFPHINEIPDYVDMSYSSCFDCVTAQKLLDIYGSVSIVAKEMNVNPHIIYDSIANKRMHYPETYRNNKYIPVVQLDLNGECVREYNNISQAEKHTGVNGISQAFRKGRNYCGGYYWVKKDDYDAGNYNIVKTRLKI